MCGGSVANPGALFDFSPKDMGMTYGAGIEFYVPSSVWKTPTKWIPPEQRGKVIPFDLIKKKSA